MVGLEGRLYPVKSSTKMESLVSNSENVKPGKVMRGHSLICAKEQELSITRDCQIHSPTGRPPCLTQNIEDI